MAACSERETDGEGLSVTGASYLFVSGTTNGERGMGRANATT